MELERQTRCKTAWMLVKRYDQDDHDGGKGAVGKPEAVSYRGFEDSVTMQQKIRKIFNLADHLVLKLRNSKGSLVPINSGMKPTSQSVPYILEVVRQHQYVKVKPRTGRLPKYNETLKKTLQGFEQRMDKLESVIPELSNRRNERIHKDMTDLDHKLLFLNKRFDEAQRTEWQGMFKKQPLW